MEYVFLVFCVLVFTLFGLYVMHKIVNFLSSADFKFYTDKDEITSLKKSKEKKIKK